MTQALFAPEAIPEVKPPSVKSATALLMAENGFDNITTQIVDVPIDEALDRSYDFREAEIVINIKGNGMVFSANATLYSALNEDKADRIEYFSGVKTILKNGLPLDFEKVLKSYHGKSYQIFKGDEIENVISAVCYCILALERKSG